MTHDTVYIGIITGSSDILCHTERIAGFTDTLKPEQERMHIVSIVETQDDEIESYEQTSRLLKEHPEINALFFAAGGVYGGCRAITSLGFTDKLCVIAFDKADTTEHFLQEGVLSAVICQQPHIQGRKPLDLLFTYLTSGELPEKEYNYTAVDIRILENI
ncbi:MAG: substrate-binding domain-containing protein [Lachnospiraceae bacterium]|nr:substrate-binding domain-containing protein [Lachnospiraceae bacterium]